MFNYQLISNHNFFDNIWLEKSIADDILGLVDSIIVFAKLKEFQVNFDTKSNFFKTIQIKQIEKHKHYTIGFHINKEKLHKVEIFSIHQDFIHSNNNDDFRVFDFNNMLQSKTQNGMVYCLDILQKKISNI